MSSGTSRISDVPALPREDHELRRAWYTTALNSGSTRAALRAAPPAAVLFAQLGEQLPLVAPAGFIASHQVQLFLSSCPWLYAPQPNSDNFSQAILASIRHDRRYEWVRA